MKHDYTLAFERWENGELSHAEILGLFLSAIIRVQAQMLEEETRNANKVHNLD